MLAIPLGWLANRNTVLAQHADVNVSGLLYTVPSLALFVLLPPLLGTGILDPANVIVALTIYTVALLVRTVADGLAAVPSAVVNSATAMGYTPAAPVRQRRAAAGRSGVLAGLRVAAVSSISLVTVGAVIGFGGLGKMFTDGFQRDIPAEIVAGIVLVLLLALVVDGLIVLIGRRAHPVDAGRLGRREARVNVLRLAVRPRQLDGVGRASRPGSSSTSATSRLRDHRARDRPAGRRLDRAHRPGRLPRRRVGQRAARAAHARRADPAGRRRSG